MAVSPDRRARLLALRETRGSEHRRLVIGEWSLSISGLDRELAARLDHRWGGFVGAGEGGGAGFALTVFRDHAGLALGDARHGERYRLETDPEDDRVVLAHHAALCPEDDAVSSWRVAMTESALEPTDRALENAVRYLVARWCAGAGGFALHGAGVLRHGRAHVFAGPSRAGKTTAVALSPPGATSLGDDFSCVVRTTPHEAFRTFAVPFDNLEAAPADPPRGLFPIAGIWRLYQTPQTRLERPAAVRAASSLMACAAFPWAMPDLAEAVLDHARDFVATGAFGHLHFTPTPEFWSLIDGA
jgi:hypothetical protein